MPIAPTLSEHKVEILYVATLRRGSDKVELEVEEVSELNLTGEGEVPLTTRLGDLSLRVIVTSRLLQILNRVSDYRDISIELVDITNGQCIFAGVGDRAGWTLDITDASRTADLSFISRLAAQDPTDVHDKKTDRAYDTLSWSRALEVVGELADVPVAGSLAELRLDGVSICRRVTARLAGTGYKASERVGGLAVLPDGHVAVGVGPRVVWTTGKAYLPLGRLWYKNTGHDFDKEVGGRGWVVLALGYRDGMLRGIAGIPNGGIAANFSCSATPAKYGSWPSVKLQGSNCFRWWFDLCAIRGSWSQWKIYGGEDAAIWNIYSVGWPTPASTKQLGVPALAERLSGTTFYITKKGDNAVAVYKDGPLRAARVGDYIDVKTEFCGPITRLVHQVDALWLVFNHKLERQYGSGTNIFVYKQGTFPTDNVLLARPTPVIIAYHDPLEWGGRKVEDVKALRRRHQNSSGSRFYAPIAVDNVDGETIGPGYVALQAESSRMSFADKISYAPAPRNFDAYFPGRCTFPPDLANHIAYRQSRRLRGRIVYSGGGGIYADQGPVEIYEDGIPLANNMADGSVVTVQCKGKTWVLWEDLGWRSEDNHRYPVLRMGYVRSTGFHSHPHKIIQTWENRDRRNPHATPEYYITSPLVVRNGKIYGAIRVRERSWKDINATVIAVGPDTATKFEPGSLPLMFNRDLDGVIETGDEIRIGTRYAAVYTVAEVAPHWRILDGNESHVCDNLGAYNGPATVLGLSDVDGITGGEQATRAMKAKYCGQKIKLATAVQEYGAVFEFDPAKSTFKIKNRLIYDTGWPKIDEEAEFARENIRGETIEAEEKAVPVGWAIYKAANKTPLDETHVRVWANKRYLDVVDVTGRISLPAPEDGKAYINYRAGADADELWVYLSERYLDAVVVVRYDYYPGVPITAVWPWGDDIYFGSADGYIWRLDGTVRVSVGKFPDSDYALEWAVSDDTTWLLTAGGRLAKHDKYHSGCIEGDFGGDDQDLFHLVAEIARASGTPIRETPDGLYLGGTKKVNLADHDVVHVGERPVRDVRALEVSYADGSVVAGDAKAKSEQTAQLPTPLIYTPQHAKAVAEMAWKRIASARRRVILEGVSADPMDVALATTAIYSNSVYEILRLGILQNDYRLEARDVTPTEYAPTLPDTVHSKLPKSEYD